MFQTTNQIGLVQSKVLIFRKIRNPSICRPNRQYEFPKCCFLQVFVQHQPPTTSSNPPLTCQFNSLTCLTSRNLKKSIDQIDPFKHIQTTETPKWAPCGPPLTPRDSSLPPNAIHTTQCRTDPTTGFINTPAQVGGAFKLSSRNNTLW